MADYREESLYEILGEILGLLPQSLDFTETSADATPEIVHNLTTVAICINMLVIHEFGGRVGPARNNALVEQVVAAAFQSFGGQDPHPKPFHKAAMLLRGIIQGHPFGDANKRTGFLVAMYYLRQVGLRPHRRLPRSEVVEFCRRISAGEIRDVEMIAGQLKGLWRAP